MKRAKENTMQRSSVAALVLALLSLSGCKTPGRAQAPQPGLAPGRVETTDPIEANFYKLLEDGRVVFRYETFGSEAYWGDQLQLHRAIAGEKYGGIGEGLTPRKALQLGLKVDFEAVPSALGSVLKGMSLSFDDVKNTHNLLKHDAVVGVKGFYEGDRLVRVGITCAICHSTVDDNFAKGIGRRLDGWPNRDLDVGAIVALAPNLSPLAQQLGVDVATVKKVLLGWGPGKYDAELNLDAKGFRPDGASAATVLPAAFGLAGVNLHTYTGWGTVTYWNAYVANTQMHGRGTFFDARLDDSVKFPVAARTQLGHTRAADDRASAKLAALHFYQLVLPPPKPPEDSYDKPAAQRGKALFEGKARCATCHVPPLFTEPGWAMHTPAEIGIDDFQASRSPDGRYRTTPLRALFIRAKGGFYHDGRFKDLAAVVAHYDRHLRLGLSDAEANDLINYLKSL
jgi:mono/diheme cytochrome c family protein